MPTFKHNAGEIYYETYGKGNPIVLIHGFGMDSRVWEKQIAELSKTNQVVVYDMRGFGKSSLPTGSYSHHEDLYKLLEELRIEKAQVVGHSLGGEVAINLALDHPEKVKNLILIGTALGGFKGDSSEWEVLSELGKKKELEDLRERLLSNPIFDDLRRKPNGDGYMLVKKMINDYSGFHFTHKDPREYIDSASRLSELSVPVKLVVGENELETQKEVLDIFEKELGIEAEIVEGCGHMSVLERGELVTQIIKKFNDEEF